MINELQKKSFEKAKEKFKDVILKIEGQMELDAENGLFATNWNCDEPEFVYEDDIHAVAHIFRERGFDSYLINSTALRISWEYS